MAKRMLRHMVILIILITILLILNGKLLIHQSGNIPFLIYGATVTIVIFLLFFVSHRYIDLSEEIRKHNLNKDKKKPLISCVLAVHNDEKIIGPCIRSLLDSDYPHKEIIVVNDASTDRTANVLAKFESEPNVKIISLTHNVGKKKAITKGLEIANGDFYIFTDSDSVVEKSAISRIMDIFLYDKDVGAISGHGRALNANKNIITKIQDSWYDGQFSVKKAFESVFGAVTCVSGPLAAFRKDAVFNYIPAWANDTFLGKEFRFSTDRTLTGYVLGGAYIGEKLKRQHQTSWFVRSQNYPAREWKILYCKSAKVWTHVPDTFSKLIKQQVRWKKSFVRNIFLTGKFYWRKPLIPALRYYLTIIFVFSAPFIVFRQMIWMPLHGNYLSPLLYIGGVLFVGSLYSIVYKLDNPHCHKWIYRPLMSVLSTTIFSWLLFYSIATIKKSIWHRG